MRIAIRWGSVSLFYAAVFVAAALLAISSGSYRRLWVVLAALAVPMLALTAMGGFPARPLGVWTSAGLVLILAFAAVRITRSRGGVT